MAVTIDLEELAHAVVVFLAEHERREPWRRDALCREYPHIDWHGELTVAARAVCHRCPVRRECMAAALNDPELRDLPGILAGLSTRERAGYARAGLTADEILDGAEVPRVPTWTCTQCGAHFERTPRVGKPDPLYCSKRCSGLGNGRTFGGFRAVASPPST